MGRQKKLPGIAPDKVSKKIAARGEAYVAERDKRIRQSKKEKESKNALIQSMEEEGVDTYKDLEADPPVVIVLTKKTDVHVTELRGAEADEETEEEPAKSEEKKKPEEQN